MEDITSSAESLMAPLRWTLPRQILYHIWDDENRHVTILNKMVEQYMAKYTQALDVIDGIPDIVWYSTQVNFAETELDMDRFPSTAHLCPWTEVSPVYHGLGAIIMTAFIVSINPGLA